MLGTFPFSNPLRGMRKGMIEWEAARALHNALSADSTTAHLDPWADERLVTDGPFDLLNVAELLLARLPELAETRTTLRT